MITYRLLSSTDLLPLYECFLAAFSDYQVDMQMSQEQFQQRIVRDGVQLEISAGAFDQAEMIGFYMNALGVWQGKNTAYDAGTGVIPAYRGQGLGKDLFAFVAPRLKEAGFEQYLLEVLSSNEPAIALYRRLGFVDARKLAVFRASEPVLPLSSPEGVVTRRVDQPDWELFESFWDGTPSWQNSIDAVERIATERTIVCAYVNDRCVGYGVAFKPGASLMQLAVSRAHRRKGIGSALLATLQNEISAKESLKVNNIDDELQGTLDFFEANGFKLALRQFEMIKTL